VVFQIQTDYEEIELQNLVVTSFQGRHHNYITEKRHQIKVTNFFPFSSPYQKKEIEISGYASEDTLRQI